MYNANNDNDDRTRIREDTLTMQLAIPPDLCIYNRHKHIWNVIKIAGATE